MFELYTIISKGRTHNTYVLFFDHRTRRSVCVIPELSVSAQRKSAWPEQEAPLHADVLFQHHFPHHVSGELPVTVQSAYFRDVVFFPVSQQCQQLSPDQFPLIAVFSISM